MESRVCVLITSYNDPRIKRTIESLLNQKFDDFWILVADGGSSSSILEICKDLQKVALCRGICLDIRRFPGSVAETRNSAFEYILDVLSPKNLEAICLIDTDEIAPSHWIEKISSPILEERAHFSFGPTKPILNEATWVTRYVYFDEARMYRMVKDGIIHYGAMGNSCWSSKMLRVLKKKYGYYVNPKLRMGGEDYDLTLRALTEGFRGIFVKDAWVWHDQTKIRTIKDLVKKKYRYLAGAYLSYLNSPLFYSIPLLLIIRKYFKYGIHFLDILTLMLSILVILKFRRIKQEGRITKYKL